MPDYNPAMSQDEFETLLSSQPQSLSGSKPASSIASSIGPSQTESQLSIGGAFAGNQLMPPPRSTQSRSRSRGKRKASTSQSKLEKENEELKTQIALIAENKRLKRELAEAQAEMV